MKKIVFKKVYMCKKCLKKIVGYVNKCPICKGEVINTFEDKIITLVKGKNK